MKRKNIVLVSLLILFGFLIQSCSKDDTTFTTQETATIPVSVSPVVSSHGTVLCPGPDSTATLGWTYNDLSGAAHTWTVYFGEAKKPPVIATGVTGTSYVVKVKEAKTYYWKVETVDARGIVTTSPTYSFTAVIGTNDKMFVNLICETDVYKQMGLNYTADQTVDLRLYFLKKSDLSLAIPEIDNGYANEVYRYVGDLPDGDYYIAVNTLSTLNAGALKKTITMNLYLQFTQLGLNYTYLEFPSVMTDLNLCDSYKAILCEFNKTGAVYTINKDIKYYYGTTKVPEPFAGTWLGDDAGDDGSGYRSHIIGKVANNKLSLDSLAVEWMYDWWGEEVVEEYPITNIIFDYCNQRLQIPSQIHLQTKYKGELQTPYYVKTVTTPVSTYDLSGAYPVMHIYYDLVQGSTAIASYLYSASAWPHKYFTAAITLDPAGKKVVMPKGQSEAIKKAILELKEKMHK